MMGIFISVKVVRRRVDYVDRQGAYVYEFNLISIRFMRYNTS